LSGKSGEEESMALIKESKVATRYGVDKRTLARWDAKPEMGFPPVIYVNGQRYRDADMLAEFDAARVRASMLERHGERHERRVAHAKSASKARQIKRQLAAQSTTSEVA
jgi:hypothetical protein